MVDRLAALASMQFGLVTLDQAIGVGFSKAALSRRLKSGGWTRVQPGVYSLPGSVDSWERGLKAVQLWVPDAIVSHRAAAAVWELEGVTDPPVEVTKSTKSGPRQHRGLIFHSTAYLPNRHVTRQRGFTVTTATRTLLDLGAVVPRDVVELALDDALRKRHTAIPLLIRILNEAGVSGRSGTAVLRELVNDRPMGERPTDSGFETRLFRVFQQAKLPRPVKQFVVRDERGRFVAQPDFAIPSHKIAIEAESYRYHMGRNPFLGDIEKHNLLTGLGWRILKVTWEDLVHRPQWVVHNLRALLEAA